METEKDRLERRISALAVAMEVMTEEGEDTTSAEVTLSTLKDRLAALTHPAIKDDVLVSLEEDPGTFYRYGDLLERNQDKAIPITIEELLPTLAQWVPGAVRWEYSTRDRIMFIGGIGETWCRIPASPRDDWQEVGGEL